MLNGLKEKVAKVAIATVLKGAAEGKYGPKVQAAYWKLAGSKTMAGVALGFVAGVIEAGQSSGLCDIWGLDCGGYIQIVKQVTGYSSLLFVFLGQVDAGVRAEPPQAPAQ